MNVNIALTNLLVDRECIQERSAPDGLRFISHCVHADVSFAFGSDMIIVQDTPVLFLLEGMHVAVGVAAFRREPATFFAADQPFSVSVAPAESDVAVTFRFPDGREATVPSNEAVRRNVALISDVAQALADAGFPRQALDAVLRPLVGFGPDRAPISTSAL